MASTLEELEKQARTLTPNEKAALAHLLIAQLDTSCDVDAERLWVELALQRYDAFVAGKLPAVPGEEAMRRARARLE
jgi:hypothetical protein